MKIIVSHKLAASRAGGVNGNAEDVVESIIPNDEQVKLVNSTIYSVGGFTEGLSKADLKRNMRDKCVDGGEADSMLIMDFVGGSMDPYLQGIPEHFNIASINVTEDGMLVNVRLNENADNTKQPGY